VTPIVVKVDASGISAPTMDEIVAYLEGQYRAIYGVDIDIDPDTQDGQLIGIFADAINDMNMSAVAAFNSFRPGYAVGAGLSTVVKINGIRRRRASSSRATVTVGGEVGVTIQNQYISDDLNIGYQWFIIGPVTIPPSGFIDTFATCMTPGAIQAAPGTLTRISTPVRGWQTVTNANAAIVGKPVETDAQLRRRQTKSTALPALTVLESMEGNLLATNTVTRARVYQNDTNLPDQYGLPARSITCVVEGTDALAIGTTIANTKTPGVPTNGDVRQIILDKYGMPARINYYQLQVAACRVLVTIHAVVGYVDGIADYIRHAVANFINNLEIGQYILTGDLYSPANLDGDAAIEATQQPQSELDTYGATYSIDVPYGLAVARSDMYVINGPFAAGSAFMYVLNGGYFYIGEPIWIALADGSFHRTIITNMSNNAIWFANPTGAQINNYAPVYAVDDVYVNFNEAAACHPDNVTVVPV